MKKMLIILLLLCFVLPTAQAAEGEKVLRVPADVSFVSEEDETAFRAAIEAAFAQRQPDVQIQWVEAHGDTDVIAAGSGLYTVEVNGERTTASPCSSRCCSTWRRMRKSPPTWPILSGFPPSMATARARCTTCPGR